MTTSMHPKQFSDRVEVSNFGHRLQKIAFKIAGLGVVSSLVGIALVEPVLIYGGAGFVAGGATGIVVGEHLKPAENQQPPLESE